MKMKQPPKCLNRDCPNPAWARGLCQTCISLVRKLVQEGLITEQELIDSGKILKAKATGRPADSIRRKWFLEGKEQQ